MNEKKAREKLFSSSSSRRPFSHGLVTFTLTIITFLSDAFSGENFPIEICHSQHNEVFQSWHLWRFDGGKTRHPKEWKMCEGGCERVKKASMNISQAWNSFMQPCRFQYHKSIDQKLSKPPLWKSLKLMFLSTHHQTTTQSFSHDIRRWRYCHAVCDLIAFQLNNVKPEVESNRNDSALERCRTKQRKLLRMENRFHRILLSALIQFSRKNLFAIYSI